MFYFDEINGKKILKSDIIKTEHFFTTRETIIKSKELDCCEIVETNKRDICDYLKISVGNLRTPSQTHTANVAVASVDIKNYPDTDGLIVSTNDIAVFLNFADCTPLIFYDEVKNIGAVSHAGWRGTAANIAANTINKMVQDFGCNPKNISVAIGAAISYCCFNVGQDVCNQIEASVRDFSGLAEIRNGEIFVDLKAVNARQIQECGVEKIDISPYCTCCNNDLFFSYRKENATPNRHSAVLKVR